MSNTENVSPRPRLVAEREVETVEATEAKPSNESASEANAAALLGVVDLGLKVLSQRAVAFAGHLLPLFALGSALYVWQSVMSSPTVYQLVGLGLFGLFTLSLVVLRRK